MSTPATPPHEYDAEDPNENDAHTPNYQYGYWYHLSGYDWYFRPPLRLTNTLTPNEQSEESESRNDDLLDDLLPEHLNNVEELHELILEIDYGTLYELPVESGVSSTLAYLLHHFLNTRAQERATGRTSSHLEKTPTTPAISVLVGKSFFEIAARAIDPADIIPVWDDLALAFEQPQLLYTQLGMPVPTDTIALMREANLLDDALRNRREHYTGTLWHNDLTLRTGLNGASLAPLDTTHIARRITPALTTLTHELDPRQGKRRCSMRTTHPTLMGIAFTTPPKPYALENFFDDTDDHQLQHSAGGSLETDDNDVLLSVNFPLSLSYTMTSVLLAQITAQIIYETTGERAQLRADRYVYGNEFVTTFAIGGDWSTEDARNIITSLMNVPTGGTALLPDLRLSAFIDEFQLDGHFESVLYTRRVESETITPDLLREQLYDAFSRFHLPEQLIRGELLEKYPPLTTPLGMRVSYGSGDGAALPPSLEVGELERDFLEPDGEHFYSRLKLGTGKYPYLAPHRLSLSEEQIVGEWFEEENPESALTRRIALRWDDLRAWFTIGEATALMDKAGRVIFFIPTLYDRVGDLYTAVNTHHERVKAHVLNASGGEFELRQRVRDLVGYHAQMTLAHKIKTAQNNKTSYSADTERSQTPPALTHSADESSLSMRLAQGKVSQEELAARGARNTTVISLLLGVAVALVLALKTIGPMAGRILFWGTESFESNTEIPVINPLTIEDIQSTVGFDANDFLQSIAQQIQSSEEQSD